MNQSWFVCRPAAHAQPTERLYAVHPNACADVNPCCARKIAGNEKSLPEPFDIPVAPFHDLRGAVSGLSHKSG
jgi:hypothetical protein